MSKEMSEKHMSNHKKRHLFQIGTVLVNFLSTEQQKLKTQEKLYQYGTLPTVPTATRSFQQSTNTSCRSALTRPGIKKQIETRISGNFVFHMYVIFIQN